MTMLQWMKISFLRVLAGIFLVFAVWQPSFAENEIAHRVVVELYTSQGCYSCPPAEAILDELTDRQDVLALEFHIDYWDYIGWKDPFAKPAFTERQRRYRDVLDARYVYTPQMVFDGQIDEVGSRRMAVEEKIKFLSKQRPHRPILKFIQRENGTLFLSVEGEELGKTYDLLIAQFDDKHETQIPRGENAGKTLVNRHVVRTFDQIGQWNGGTEVYKIEMYKDGSFDGIAALLQQRGQGLIIANTVMKLQ